MYHVFKVKSMCSSKKKICYNNLSSINQIVYIDLCARCILQIKVTKAIRVVINCLISTEGLVEILHKALNMYLLFIIQSPAVR